MFANPLFDETFALSAANVAMAAVTLGLVAYFAAALIYGLLVTWKRPAGQR